MNFSVALGILIFGVVLGLWLHAPLQRLRAWVRRWRYRPQVLRPYRPRDDDDGARS